MRVAVVGSHGRMGAAVLEAVAAADDIELAVEVNSQDDLVQALKRHQPDVAIDFTSPEAISESLPIYLHRRVRPVVGTTGIAPRLLSTVLADSRKVRLGGVIAANFSVGAVLMMQLAERASKHLRQVEILEFHHTAKKDAPSGTAMATQERLQRGGIEVPIHSVRLDGFLASQEVLLSEVGERLSIRHDSIDRRCFMPGVLLAARRCMELTEIVVGLDSLLDLSP